MRFFCHYIVSFIAQAREERAIQRNRQDTYLYFDEARDYVDDEIGVVYQQMRKCRFAMTIVQPDLAQLPSSVASVIMTSSATKFASGIRSKDACPLADDMRCGAHFIMNHPSLNSEQCAQAQCERKLRVAEQKLTCS